MSSAGNRDAQPSEASPLAFATNGNIARKLHPEHVTRPSLLVIAYHRLLQQAERNAIFCGGSKFFRPAVSLGLLDQFQK